jgi:hypothetical protein
LKNQSRKSTEQYEAGANQQHANAGGSGRLCDWQQMFLIDCNSHQASLYFVTNACRESKHSSGGRGESRKKRGKHFLLTPPPVLLKRIPAKNFFLLCELRTREKLHAMMDYHLTGIVKNKVNACWIFAVRTPHKYILQYHVYAI